MQLNDDGGELTLERVFVVLRRRWWVVALSTILVGAAAFIFSESEQRQYTATTSVVFQDAGVSQQAAGLQLSSTPTSLNPQLMATNVNLVTQESGVAAATARAVGHGLTGSDVASAVTATEQGQTDLVDVSATSTSPGLAAEIANTYAQQFIATQRSQQQAAVLQGLNLVERQIAATSRQQLAGPTGQALLDRAESLRILAKLQNGGAQVASVAATPTSPSSPKTKRNVALGLILGLLLGLAIAFLLERLDRRMNDVEDVGVAYQLPVLAAVPHNKHYALPPQPDAVERGGDAEVFRLLRAYLRYFNVDRELRLLLVSSASPGDGKTTISRNLAEAAQETGTRTLLLEADLRRPGLATHYGLASAPGLSEVLIGRSTAADAIRSVPIATRVNGSRGEVVLDVLVAGHAPPNPAELLESHAMADVLGWVSDRYELVIIDTPPLAVVSDAMSLLQKVDGVVLVSQLEKNTRDSAAFLRERLTAVNAPLLGVVANGIRPKGRHAYVYGYGYGYYGAEIKTEDPGALTLSGEPNDGSR
jgi:capsular exopolysaccharide synthesis family protein